MSNIYISKDTKKYINEVQKKYKELNRNELKELFVRKNNGDLEARNILIEKSLYLVVPLALEYSKLGFNIDDLIQIGNIALIRSIDKFDINKSFGFKYYCSVAIMRYFSVQSDSFFDKGFTCEERYDLIKILKERQTELEKFETSSSVEELCEKLNLDINKMSNLVGLFDFNKKVISLSADEDLIYQNINDTYFDLDEIIDKNEENLILNKCINTLALKKQELIKIRFGFDGRESLSPQETANYYNISRQSVDDQEVRRLRRIKKKIKSDYPEYYEKTSSERVMKKNAKKKIREV